MPFATSIVPMPRWSTPVGCTKLVLTIVVLAFVAACATISGCYPAFSILLFTASLSLVTFGYYMLALSFRPSLYNKWIILSLETILTLFWFVSLILLAEWTGASSGIPRYYYELTPYPISIKSSSGALAGRDEMYRRDTVFPSSSWSSSGLCKRVGTGLGCTGVKHHGENAHYAAQILAGIAAGLAGLIFILYGTTTATFALNFHQTTTDTDTETTTHVATVIDEEAQTQLQTPTASPLEICTSTTVPPSQHSSMIGTHPSPLRSNSTHAQTITAVPVSPTTSTLPPSTDERLDIDTLPRDFEPTPERKTYYGSIEQSNGDEMGISAVEEKEVDGKRKSTTIKEDGRVEREI